MIRVMVQDGTAIVTPEGNLDVDSIAELQKILENNAENGGVTVDLKETSMLSSSAIGALIAGHNVLRQAGKRLKIESASDGIRHLMRIMGLDRHFEIA